MYKNMFSIMFVIVFGAIFLPKEIILEDNPSFNKNIFQDNEPHSGCCSYHGGVCGCSFGRLVCCDGIFSPTCKC
jgi:hypothetical protein